jgi:hypothetical protein
LHQITIIMRRMSMWLRKKFPIPGRIGQVTGQSLSGITIMAAATVSPPCRPQAGF